ncbi:AAA family ATPase [Andreprevotia chitinilytica]|uniref:AAA family ATPase n=1 Tax=Andreprevotia chitinilytica TaxID=396808 RepID=UPI000559775B|nr:ATP-binding protein [Andreprevotia chitinilytica]
MNIQKIRVSGFKSVADVTLNQLTPYSVFAGPNGAGKSNLADALAFVSAVIQSGANSAIRRFNGFAQIHCYKFKKDKTRTFEFNLDATMNGEAIVYHMKIHHLDKSPMLEEMLSVAGKSLMMRKKGNPPSVRVADADELVSLPEFPDEMSGLILLPKSPLYQYLINLRVFRFDPLGAKIPDESSTDAIELHPFGHNLATILARLEKDQDIRTEIIDWMELLVPGMEKVSTEQQRLGGNTVIKFKEEGTKAHFPANLISDGTIYALCIMTAVLSRAKEFGPTFIEEPERGIHPKAIAQLVELMRANASPEHPVFVTTHSESVVRASTKEELWLVNKEDGKTQIKNAALHSGDLGDLNLDKAWLMNLFDGGLPW